MYPPVLSAACFKLEISNADRDVILTEFKKAYPRGERYSHLDQEQDGDGCRLFWDDDIRCRKSLNDSFFIQQNISLKLGLTQP
jgi:hypothetical protein